MFELEFINLLNQFKNTEEKYEKNKIKTSISSLIKQNSEEYEKFIQLQPLDEQTKQLLSECEQNNQEIENQKHQNSINAENDFSIIKNNYYKWLENFQNNQEVNLQCKEIVREIIDHYVNHRFNILEKIFKLKDDENFEKFKWHIKNELRIYFINKIETYLESDNFKELSFFAQRRKKSEIKVILNQLTDYKFNPKKINEVLE